MTFKYYCDSYRLVYRINRKNNTIEFYSNKNAMWLKSELYDVINDVVSDKSLQKIEKAELVLII